MADERATILSSSIYCESPSTPPSVRLIDTTDGWIEPSAHPHVLADVVISARRMESEGLDAETLGERLGWDIRGVLTDPEALWNFNVVGLRDVCHGVGIDWLAVLP